MIRLCILSVVLLLDCGRGNVTDEGGQPSTRLELSTSSWASRRITAARCNDDTLEFTFRSDGSLGRRFLSMVDSAGACREHVEAAEGRWDSGAGTRVTLDWGGGRADVTAVTMRFAPRVRVKPAPRIEAGLAGARALSLRAFERQSTGAYVDEHRWVERGRDTWTRTVVELGGALERRDASTSCTMSVEVTVDVDGQRATERLTPPCRWWHDPVSRFTAAGNLDRLPYRADALIETGARERHSPAVFAALVDGLVLGLVVDEDAPGAAVPAASYDRAEGWFDASP